MDLSKAALLGGHSFPRSFYNSAGPNVGSAIMLALSQQARLRPSISILEGHKLKSLEVQGGTVVGVNSVKVAERDGQGMWRAVDVAEQSLELVACDAVVLATGGFAANKELLRLHSPVAAGLATTNGPSAQGEGLAIAQAVGAEVVHLDQVQVLCVRSPVLAFSNMACCRTLSLILAP